MAVIAGIVANRLWKNGKCKRHSNEGISEKLSITNLIKKHPKFTHVQIPI